MISQYARPVLLAFAAIAAIACTSGKLQAPPDEAPADPSAAYVSEYRIGVGDTISVSVWRNPELSITVPVRPDGRISVPLAGDVDVAGQTPESVADAVEAAIGEFVRDPNVSIIVTNIGSMSYMTRVRVTGAVRNPISVPYRPGMTVMDVVLEAGGPNEFANERSAALYRQGEAPRGLDLDGLLRRGNLGTNYQLKPGDVITVPESSF